MATLKRQRQTDDTSGPATKKLRTATHPGPRQKARAGPQQHTVLLERVGCDHAAADLRRFARGGGPDLSSLRGFPNPSLEMAGGRSERSNPKSDKRTRASDSASETTKRSSAADSTFEHVLIENHIYPDGYAYHQGLPKVEAENVDEIRYRLARPRTSISPSRRDPAEFENFRRVNATALSEAKVMSKVLPFFCGDTDAQVASQENLLFNNIASLTGKATVDPKPDLYDGASSSKLHTQVWTDLNSHVVPTRHDMAPVAPNYFLEAKSLYGKEQEARRQIAHDIAVGARAMHSLQTYREVASYDGNANTLGVTYHASGLLKIYTGHMLPGSDGTETHVNQVCGFDITGDEDTYYRGIAAFRNGRELALEFRDTLISSANSRAQTETQPPVGNVQRDVPREDAHLNLDASTVPCRSRSSSYLAASGSDATTIRTSPGQSSRDGPRAKRQRPSSSPEADARRLSKGKQRLRARSDSDS